MVTENTKIKRLTKWALFVGLGLIICLLVGERYAPRYFGGSGDMIAGVLGAAFIFGWLVCRLLWPLAILAAGLLYIGIRGAASLFAFAAEQGFVGIAAYIACWVFMFPVMLTASAITGCIVAWTEHADEHARSTSQPISPSAQAALWREEDLRHEEHKRRLVEAARARGEH